jgi:RNA polymerase sigma factor (sigma-70 family)
MKKATVPPALRFVRGLVIDQQLRSAPDGDLIARFIGHKDEEAFAALLGRHGPMVHQVCRSLLRNDADADDAFQATFLVLARKADSVRKSGSIASWLYGVAHHTVLKARARRATRRRYEQRAPLPREPGPLENLTWLEAQAVVHEELARLPEKYRAPLVLCYLEGHKQDDAAGLLHCPPVTFKSRLERARELLRGRLTRRGLGPGAVLSVAVALAGNASAGPLPPPFVATAQAAVSLAAGKAMASAGVNATVTSLTQAVIRTMTITRLKCVAGVFLAVVLVGFGAVQLIPAAVPTGAPTRRVARPARKAENAPVRPGDPASRSVPELMQQWEKRIRDRVKRDAKLTALAAKHPLVVLHSREKYTRGDYKQSCYSFIYETADPAKHGNEVELQFDNGGPPNRFNLNMSTHQQNLVVDLGKVDFAKDPDPATISINHEGVFSASAKAVEGHVYMERIRDDQGNNFYVLFQVVAVDKESRYVGFLWRKLPGGKVVKRKTK